MIIVEKGGNMYTSTYCNMRQEIIDQFGRKVKITEIKVISIAEKQELFVIKKITDKTIKLFEAFAVEAMLLSFEVVKNIFSKKIIFELKLNDDSCYFVEVKV